MVFCFIGILWSVFLFLCFLLLADFRFWLLSIKQSQIAFFSLLQILLLLAKCVLKTGTGMRELVQKKVFMRWYFVHL